MRLYLFIKQDLSSKKYIAFSEFVGLATNWATQLLKTNL